MEAPRTGAASSDFIKAQEPRVNFIASVALQKQAAASTLQTEKAAASLTDLSSQLEAATEGYRL